MSPALAKSGEVDLERIKVDHTGVTIQATGEELAYTTITVRVPVTGDNPDRTLLQLVELEPVRDNTGKLLSTEERMEDMERFAIYLHKYSREVYNIDSSTISLHMQLDAPAVGAKSIPVIKGKLLHSEAELVLIDVKDLTEHKHRKVEHPHLGKIQLATDVVLVDGQTEVSMHIPRLSRNQIDDWNLISKDGNRPLKYRSESSSPQGETNFVTKTYNGNLIQKAFLRIELNSPTKSRELDFEFNDIALP